MEFAEKLITLRKSRELTQEQLAEQLQEKFLRCFHLTSLAELPPVQHPQEASAEENKAGPDAAEI